jgi:hypothetical protein
MQNEQHAMQNAQPGLVNPFISSDRKAQGSCRRPDPNPERFRIYSPNSDSIFAAQMKSLSDSPPTAWVL